MAKQAIPEELDLLIQEYLTDGIITDKERAVLLRKAEKLGLDVDEIDLYIDAQQQKADQVIDVAAKKKRGQTCPFCGGSVPQLADKCPHCGQHITAEASEELKEIIENLEEALVDFKSGKDFAKSKATAEKYLRKATLYYGGNPKIQRLTEEVAQEIAQCSNRITIDARKKWILDHLMNVVFAGIILFEFLCLLISRLIDGDYWEYDDGSHLILYAIIATAIVWGVATYYKVFKKK